MTLITGVGELSHTHCNMLVNRVLKHRRKTRILYISDFDPAGDGMPVSIARKIEHILRRDDHDDLDIRLDPLLLTATQVKRTTYHAFRSRTATERKGISRPATAKARSSSTRWRPSTPANCTPRPGTCRSLPRADTRDPKEIATVTNQLERHAGEVRETVLDHHGDEIAHLRADFDRMKEDHPTHQEAMEALVAEYEDRMARRIGAINTEVARFYDQAEPVIADIATDLETDKPDPDDSNGRTVTRPTNPTSNCSRPSATTSSKSTSTRRTRASRPAGGPATTGDDLYRQRPRAGEEKNLFAGRHDKAPRGEKT